MSNSESEPDQRSARWAGAALTLVDMGVLLGLVVCLLSWLFSPVKELALGQKLPLWTPKLLLLPVVLFVVRCVLRMAFRAKGLGWVTKLSLAVCSILFPLAFVEQLFEFARYERSVEPILIVDEAGSVSGDKRLMLPDRELMWRFNPGVFWNGRHINALGHPEREVEVEKAPGVTRIICLGDSVTGQGPPTYATVLHELLQERPLDGRTWEAYGMGVHGYSTAQGLRLFLRPRTQRMEPDVVTIFYGWNDHWLAVPGKHDSTRMAKVAQEANWITAAHAVLRQKRFGQYLLSLVTRDKQTNRHAQDTDPENEAQVYHRVPKEEYVENLKRMIATARGMGAVPVLLTAPRAKRISGALVPKQCHSVEQGLRSHDAYVELTRQVGAETNTVVLDLAAEMVTPELQQLFTKDGIHFGGEGRAYIGRRLYETLEQVVASDAWKAQK